MTGREWQPGDVALVDSWRGAGQIAFRVNRLHDRDVVWCVLDGADTRGLSDDEVRRAQRVAVIAYEDREQVERLAKCYREVHGEAELTDEPWSVPSLRMQAALREFASPTPPTPDEPGRWGVVEASCVHSLRRLHWMRHEDDNWWPFAPYGEDDRRPLPDDWESLVDPVVVRDGVAGEPS